MGKKVKSDKYIMPDQRFWRNKIARIDHTAKKANAKMDIADGIDIYFNPDPPKAPNRK